jgi:hypothetical protein
MDHESLSEHAPLSNLCALQAESGVLPRERHQALDNSNEYVRRCQVGAL